MLLSRRGAIGAVVVVACIIGGALAMETVFAGRDPNTIHAPGSLPDRISLCGRDWTKDTIGREVTFAQARIAQSGDPIVVAIGPFAPCPSGACTDTAGGPCDTVVWVRTGDDAYIGYELSGGP